MDNERSRNKMSKYDIIKRSKNSIIFYECIICKAAKLDIDLHETGECGSCRTQRLLKEWNEEKDQQKKIEKMIKVKDTLRKTTIVLLKCDKCNREFKHKRWLSNHYKYKHTMYMKR
jgi:DNA-directed RNA polymerase subunit RPC12/RpoP